MRTDKHLLKLNYENHPEDFNNLLDVMHAYQKQKNSFSDYLNNYHWNNKINLLQNAFYFDIRNNLMRDSNFTSIKNLPSRLWKMALKEAYDLHFRTNSAQIEEVKTKVSDYVTKTESFKDIKSSFYHILNYICYNYNTFSSFEKTVFPYKFNSNKKKYLKSKKHFLLFIDYLNGLLTKEKTSTNLKKSISVLLTTENIQSFSLTKKICNYLIKIVKKKYHQTRQIVSQINPTIILDSDCYKLSVDKKTGECFIDIISLNKGKRIKNIPLSGYKNSLPKIKNFASNICVSFDPVEARFYLHFSFNIKNKNKSNKNNVKNNESIILGGDFGETEMMTLSDQKVIGENQGNILKAVAKQTEKALTKVQTMSLKLGDLFFGIEKKNIGRRNKRNNAFNHNKNKKNINYDYRKSQTKINRRLNQHISKCVNELKHHCEKNNVSELVVEDLTYSKLGRNKSQKQVFNLTKGFYGKIEEKIPNLKLTYVNPAFTSQICPLCGYLHKNNRSGDEFLCLECKYTPNVKCSKADYIAALNIKARQFTPMLRMSPQKVKDILLQRFEENKVKSCNQQNLNNSNFVEVLENALF